MKIRAILLSTVAALTLSLDVHARDGERTRKGSFHTSNGNSGTVESRRMRAGTESSHSKVWTTEDGKTRRRDTQRQFDQDTQSGTVESSLERANGATRIRAGTYSKGPDGAVTSSGSITGAGGKTATYASTSSKTDNGRTTATTLTGPNGKTSQVDTTVSREDGVRTRETAVTKPDGGKVTQTTTATRNGDGSGTIQSETTRADGTTKTRTVDVEVTPAP